MKMKSVEELLNLYEAINICSDLKKLKFSGTWKFAFLLSDIMKKIKSDAENYKEKINILNEEISNLRLKYCTKDSTGKPLTVKSFAQNGNTIELYTGLNRGFNKEYDFQMNEIKNKMANILKEQINIDFSDITKLDENDIHEDISEFAFMQLVLYDFIIKNNKKEEKK